MNPLYIIPVTKLHKNCDNLLFTKFINDKLIEYSRRLYTKQQIDERIQQIAIKYQMENNCTFETPHIVAPPPSQPQVAPPPPPVVAPPPVVPPPPPASVEPRPSIFCDKSYFIRPITDNKMYQRFIICLCIFICIVIHGISISMYIEKKKENKLLDLKKNIKN